MHFDALVRAARGSAPTADDGKLLELVCKHVRDVRRVATRSLADELAAPDLGEAAMTLFEVDDESLKPQAPVCWSPRGRAEFLRRRRAFNGISASPRPWRLRLVSAEDLRAGNVRVAATFRRRKTSAEYDASASRRYAALRAADRFFVKRGRWPGVVDAELEADAAAVADELRAFVSEAGAADAFGDALSEKHAAEIARFGAAELHAVAAVVGGVASQEAVKVIAKQYTPVNHTYLFNGIAATGAVFEV